MKLDAELYYAEYRIIFRVTMQSVILLRVVAPQ
jgi:hypothetical protein